MGFVALPKVSDWSLGAGLQTYGNGIIRLTEWARTIFSDDFSDSSLDSTNFGSLTAGGGTIVETSLLTLDTSAAAADAAAIYYKTALTRGGPWKIKVKIRGSYINATGGANQIFLASKSTAPVVGTGGSLDRMLQFDNDSGGLYSRVHFDASAFAYNPTSSGAYFDTTAVQHTFSTAIYYWMVIENNGTDVTLKIFTDDESTPYSSFPAHFSLQAWKQTALSLWVIIGDMYTDTYRQTSLVAGFWHYGRYVTTSPEAESPWIAIDSSTLDATTPIDTIENPLGGTGSLKYQYATNNGAYNGSWVTEASMVTALQSAAITDHTNSLRIKAQFISDGDQSVELGVASYIKANAASGGGLLIHPGMTGGMRG